MFPDLVMKRISENNRRNQENKFENQGGRCLAKKPDRITQPESENSTDEIRKHNRIGKQEPENNTNKLRQQERENQKKWV